MKILPKARQGFPIEQKSSGSCTTLPGKTVQETGGMEKKFTLIGRQCLLYYSGKPRLLSSNVR